MKFRYLVEIELPDTAELMDELDEDDTLNNHVRASVGFTIEEEISAMFDCDGKGSVEVYDVE